ncbi:MULTISPECIES: HEAT repeat domain-containing protein [unclassified Microcystis]|uniref:HEAT repeat domain-containing protein n=1 Tax=unclassified Microcystis TaxID=2643300 RepID=UPI00259077B7|nr:MULTISPECIES: HEAT repeat domain-containing protein [unclassified Microcystis]MCA2688823.1 HEAT repeat domain-containing protein [Microcystis sp. M037S2]MCA2732696.1 HEAT repeat domain-containing protein [Microcystis sp. M158S2]MCA2738411.1 HEAT repeat domain-containing protein [Microcystis sp. M165S2]MCA2754689.1 HEAT repeat domain-containing protein [Microcystis sp. M137S2]
MIDWTPYLESISEKYAQWETFYTLTDVEGKTRPAKTAPLLRDLWVQTIEKERENPQERAERPEKTERFTVLEGLRKYKANHVLLKGRPGSGKSTALARLLLEEAQSLRPNQQNQAKIIQIPILIELRLYETSILDLILQFLKRHKLIIDSNTLESWLLENQNFRPLLLFDGINELPSDPARQKLKNFRQQYAEIPMIFTTRDLGSDDLDIEKKLEMLPLTEPQMRDFVKTYLPKKGEEMLKQLGNRLKELGETPLLLWMLCSVFDNNENKIPANLGLLFRRFTEIYDKGLKADVPTYQESRYWWRELLQVLAWKMTQGESKTEIQVAISRTEAEEELTKFIKNKGFPEYYSKQWLEDLLKYHLIHLEGNEKIAFRHQLIQEYYTAEELQKKLRHLKDEQLKWDYLNYLKWTEPMALLLGLLDNETEAKRVVKLGLEIDLQLGARLAGEVNFKFQKQTVELVLRLDVPKLFKVELLGLTKSIEVVNELLKALEDSDKDVRWEAAEALGNIGSETAIAGLLKALEHSDYHVSWNAAEALAKIGSETAIPGLLKALEDSYKYVRGNAAEALAKIGTETAIPGLLKALEDSYKYVRGNAAEALGNIGSETAIAGLLKALEDSYEYVRLNAAEALGKIGSETAIPRLLKALEDSHWYVRRDAAEALGKIGSETAIPGLLKALEDSDNNVRWKAVEALGNIGTETAIPGLLKALEDSNNYGRRKAVEALAKIGSETAIPRLLKALEDSHWYVRRNAAEALGNIGTETAIPGLLKALEDSDGFVREKAAEALAKIGSETAIPGLLKALEDSDNDVREKAAEALGKIGSETAIPGLLKALEDSDGFVRWEAAEALGNIGSETAIPGLLKALEHSDEYVRRKAAEALGKIGSETAMTELIKCLKNPAFVTLNNGETLSKAREALDTIQNKLKYYHPLSQPMNQQVYISYNWQEDSNEMANQLVQAFAAKGIEIIRDKTHTTYKDSIKNFMQQIGQGKCVVAVISDRYLKSENCMFELVEIARNGDFYQRIFPIILPDARIHKDFERIDYLKYWEDEKAKLQAKYKQIDLAKTNSILATLNLYDEIRGNIDNLTNILRDMNTLNIDLHRQSEFAAMIQAVETKLAEDGQNIPTSSEKNASLSSITYDLRGATIGNLAHNVQGSQQNYPQQLNNNNPEKK